MIFEMTNVLELIAAGQDEKTHSLGSEKIPGIYFNLYLIVFMRPSSKKKKCLKGPFHTWVNFFRISLRLFGKS